ncbi:LysR family transcriptional regulator [Alkalihalobacillus macyae]|uniref:LysR family transcriptional regulator n=1 Tax=Guptibacillus hwajinpoensis TaxID=208199 RepID=UPI00273B7B6E|nr:LysR family transcriptional regulator [Alkalihalobacillus macyae]MDP4549517.1 LysR family transcriptional regulator [Alkalihalobacillus macyae]
MEINQLKAFDHVVRLGSFSKAARYLDVSQPTVSLRVKELEKSIGGSLFERVGKRMELTELGEGFLPYARQALDVLIIGAERAQSIKEGKRGQITIGTLPTFTTGLFSSTLSRMYDSYPEIDLIIHTGHNQQIIEMLYDGFIKMGLITYPFFNSDLKMLHLIKERLFLVAHKDHPISKVEERSYTVKEVFENSKPYILTDWSEGSKHWQKTHLSYGMETVELPPATALDFVRRGKGVAFLTQSLVQDLIESGTIVKLEPSHFQEINRSVALVSLECETSLTPSAKRFLEMIRISSHME